MPVIVGNQQFLFMREACSTGRKSCLVLLTWSKVYNLSNSGKGESITVVLLNGHRVKCFLNIYVCTKINGALCPCQRSPCLQWIMGNSETHNRSKSGVKCSSVGESSTSISSHPRLKEAQDECKSSRIERNCETLTS